MAAILLIGEDGLLLETRAAVLRTVGAEISCSDISSAMAILMVRPFDVVMLCHSVPDPVCETICGIMGECWPQTTVIHLSYGQVWEGSDDYGAYACSSDPEALIARTVELLGRKPMGSEDEAGSAKPMRTTG